MTVYHKGSYKIVNKTQGKEDKLSGTTPFFIGGGGEIYKRDPKGRAYDIISNIKLESVT